MSLTEYDKALLYEVRANESSEGTSVEVGERKYKFDKRSVLVSSIHSFGKCVLTAPIRLVMEENGAPAELSAAEIFLMDGQNEDFVDVAATASTEAFYVNTSTRVESDGFMRFSLRIAPRGLTVKEVFGIEKAKELGYRLDKLWVEIPVDNDSALTYQNYPRCDVRDETGKIIKKNGYLATGDGVHERIAAYPFLAQIHLSGANSGIGIVAESDEKWQPVSKWRAIEIEKKENCTVLRLRLLDSHPEAWQAIEPARARDYYRPISFEFGIAVTPLRKYPADPYRERALHIDCFKKLTSDYDDYLSGEFIKDDGTRTGEITFDRLTRLGVNTLYLHEKWNDIQNSTRLTRRSAERLRYIVSECHKRKIRVIPYFGYEISSLSPEWEERFGEGASSSGGMWNRMPHQRCVAVCPASSVKDDFASRIGALMDEFKFDGVYLDTTLRPFACSNSLHGCGYIDKVGKPHTTYPVFGVRELMKNVHREVHSRGGTVNMHTCASYNLAALAYGDSIWEGEMTQLGIFGEGLDEMPEGIYRGQFDGRVFGMPLFMLAYTKSPVWTHEHSTAFALLHGTVHKPNDADLPLESTSRIWGVLDSFPVTESEFHYYFDGETEVRSSHRNVKLSYYKHGRELLLFAANTRREVASDVVISANGKIERLIPKGDVEFGSTKPCDFAEFGYAIYKITIE